MCYGHRGEAVPHSLLIELRTCHIVALLQSSDPPSLLPAAPSYTEKAAALLWFPRPIFYQRHSTTLKPRGLSPGAYTGPGITKSLPVLLGNFSNTAETYLCLDSICSILFPLVGSSQVTYSVSLFGRVLLVLAVCSNVLCVIFYSSFS